MGYAETKKYKVLNISLVIPIGESQADHRERLQILSNWVSVIFFLKESFNLHYLCSPK